MARLTTIPPFTGTRDGICIYLMRGAFYMRTASSLNSKRVKKDSAFDKTREQAGILGKASRIASPVYRNLPSARKRPGLRYEMIRQAIKMLKNGMEERQIDLTLSQTFS